MAPDTEEMADVLDEHLPYEVLMLFVTHDSLYPMPQLHQLEKNAVIESFSIHARNLFEFFTKTTGGRDNYAFARAYVPSFAAFQDPQDSADKNALYRKICAQISHLTFNRVKNLLEKIRTNHEVPEAKRLLEAEIRAFVDKRPAEYKQHWKRGVAKCGLSRWGF